MSDFYLSLGIFVLAWLIFVKVFKIKPGFNSKFFTREVYPSSTQIRVSLVAFVGFGLLFFSSALEFNPEGIIIPVQETNISHRFFKEDSVRPVMARFNTVEIRGTPYLTDKNPDFRWKILAALVDKSYNLTDLAFFLLITLIAAIGFWNFNFKEPFKINVSRTVYIIAVTFIIYSVLCILRDTFLNNRILKVTNNIYKYDFGNSMFNFLKIFMAIMLLRLAQILRKAERLQKDQDLTV